MVTPFGSLIKPFEQHQKPLPPNKVLDPWHIVREDFEMQIHNAKNDGHPTYPEELKVLPDSLINELEENGRIISEFKIKKHYCYLWVINEFAIIEILWEDTINEKDLANNLVKHSNITSGGIAYNGGEMYFASNNRIYINNSSDRYGFRPDYWDGAINEFKRVYNKYTIIDLLA